MKLNTNERLVKIFDFQGDSTFEKLDVDTIRGTANKIEDAWVEFPLRDRVTEVDFNDFGFRELTKKGTVGLTPNGQNASSMEEYVSWFNSNAMGCIVVSYSDETQELQIAPSYVANIKDDKVYNIFDTIGRMGYYNFLTQVNDSDDNNWYIVYLIDRAYTMGYNEFFNLYGWSNPMLKDQLAGKTEYEIPPVIEVDDKLNNEDISLLFINTSLEEIAEDVFNGKYKIEDINLDFLKKTYGSIK